MPSVDDAAERGEPTPTVSMDKPAAPESAAAQPEPPNPWAVGPASVPQPGYPGPDYPGYPAWQQPPAPAEGYNGLAIAAAVTGILGIACCMWTLGIGLGIAALQQISRRNQKGRGLAITGIVAGGVWLLVLVLTAVLAVLGHGLAPRGSGSGSGDDDDPDRATSPGSVSVFSIKAGDCFDRITSDTAYVTRVRSVPCVQPHDGEVFGTAQLVGVHYPGKTETVKQSDKGCADLVDSYAMDRWALPDSVDVHFFYPDESAWVSFHTRFATCVFVSGTEKRTGSLRHDGTNLTADQLSYLQAVHHLDLALDNEPDADPADSPEENRSWAGGVADGITEEIRLQQEHVWSQSASQPVAALVAELKQSLPHWRAAEKSTDAATLASEIKQASRHLGHQQAKAARAALGLASDDSGVGVSGTNGGSPKSV